MKILDIKESLLKKHFAKNKNSKCWQQRNSMLLSQKTILIKGLFKFRQNLGLRSPNSRHQVK